MNSIIRSTNLLILLSFTCTLLLSACKTNNDVVSHGLFQKRKHRPGYHLNFAQRSQQKQARIKTEEAQWSDAAVPESTDTTHSVRPNASHSSSRLFADGRRSHASPSILSPTSIWKKKMKPKSLRKQADERTEELEELQEHKARNSLNLKITGIYSVLTFIGYITYNVLFALGIPFAPIVAIIVLPAFLLLRYFVPLFIIYLIEHFKLKKDELFFDEGRIKAFETVTNNMKRLQLISFLTTLFSVIGFIAGVFFLPAAAIISVFTFAISYFILNLASWIGIVTGFASRRYSDQSRKSLIQLIILQIAASLLLLIVFIVIILLFIGLFTGAILI